MKVVWSATARDGLEQIFAYIRQHNPKAASKVAERIVEAGDSLERWPERHPVKDDGLRSYPLSGLPYILRYDIRRDDGGTPYVAVISVKHGRQNG